MGKIVQANLWAKEGKQFKKDVWIELSRWEIAQRVLSFYPAKLSKQYEIREVEADLYNKYKTIRSKFMQEIKKGRDFGTVRDEYEKKITSHNERVEEDLFILYVALDIDIDSRVYRSIENKHTISRDDLRSWRDEAREEMRTE